MEDECSDEYHPNTLQKQNLVQFLQFIHSYEELIHRSIFLLSLTFLQVLSLAYFYHEFVNPLTRLVPKIEMPEPPKELMAPPKSLKTIVPPAAPQAELTRDVSPAGQ